MFKAQALLKLRPNAQFTMRGEEIEWLDTEQSLPSEEEILAETNRIKAEYEYNDYQRKRKPEYPPIGDQLDALWKGGDAAAEMLAKVQAVKAKYPKPTES